MKKSGLLLGAACVLAFSAVALADTVVNPDPKDGQIITNGSAIIIDTANYADVKAPREITQGEMAVGGQETKITLDAKALIPCYLSMRFQGNDTNTLIESFGKDAKPAVPAGSNFIGFYPSVGGFVNSDWSYVANSTSANAEVKPTDGKFIRGCDTFKTDIWANLPYKYSVTVSNNGNLQMGTYNLPVDMRVADAATFADAQAAWGATINMAAAPQNGTALILNNIPELTSKTIFHQFRVPYTNTVKAGTYTGSITFTAATM